LAKECVTTHQPNESALKMDDTKALDLYFTVDGKLKPQRVGGYGSLF